MLISADCGLKTATASAEVPRCEKSSRHQGLMQGRRVRYPRAVETSRYMTQSEAIAASDSNLMALDGV